MDFSDMRTCATCGEQFSVLYPDMWRYKRNGMWFCSWGCLREEERTGNMARKMTREQKEKAVEIALAGGDPLEWLRQCGSQAPDKTWWFIKQTLKEVNPEKYAQLPDLRKGNCGRKPAEPQPKQEKKPAPVPEEKKPEAVPEKKPEAPKVPEPLAGGGWEVADPKPQRHPGIRADVDKAISEMFGLPAAEKPADPPKVTGVAPLPEQVVNIDVPLVIGINDYVKVKLTVFGIKVFLDYMNAANVNVEQPVITPQNCLPRIDKDGYTELHLWEVMTIFGRELYMTSGKSVFWPMEIIKSEKQ